MTESSNITKLKKLIGYDEKAYMLDSVKNTVNEMNGDGYWAWCMRGDCCYLATPLKKMLGYKVNEITEFKDLNNLLVDEDKKRFLIELENHVCNRSTKPFKIVLHYKHKKGHIIKLLCRGMVVEWGMDGEPVKMVGSFVNITNCKEI